MKYIILFTFSLFLLSFGKHPCKDLNELPIPPSCVQIGSNFYIDETEISNIHWKEYVYWTSDVLGGNSKEHWSTLPDTLVWRPTLSYGEPYRGYYFYMQAYNSYPIIGVSYKQAQAYSKWRSDRVFESSVIESGYIIENSKSRDDYFSIESYLSKYPDTNIPIPVFRLPTKAEWEDIAKGKEGANEWGFNSKKWKKLEAKKRKKGGCFQRLQIKEDNDCESELTALVHSGAPNDYGILNMIGNVAEMVQEEGISKGGGFIHTMNECLPENEILYEAPTYWLGFRNVCTWVTAADYLENYMGK